MTASSAFADFYKQLCAILCVSDKGGKTGIFQAIQEQITYLYSEKRQPLLLAIDDAQYLNTGILNSIKMLMKYGYDSVNYFTQILCGETHLNDTLRKLVHEALRQRITIHYNYAGLSDDEVSSYILHKIQLTDALTLGSQQDKKVIDVDIIRAAVDSQGLY